MPRLLGAAGRLLSSIPHNWGPLRLLNVRGKRCSILYLSAMFIYDSSLLHDCTWVASYPRILLAFGFGFGFGFGVGVGGAHMGAQGAAALWFGSLVSGSLGHGSEQDTHGRRHTPPKRRGAVSLFASLVGLCLCAPRFSFSACFSSDVRRSCLSEFSKSDPRHPQPHPRPHCCCPTTKECTKSDDGRCRRTTTATMAVAYTVGA
jgi:hypothetical protein